MTTNDQTKEHVRLRYAQAARSVSSECCAASCCGGKSDPITVDLYDSVQAGEVPEQALLASLGCGNPTALAELQPGEVVLDLGSGGGVDVLLSARRVGPAGKAYGLDMTDEMLQLARSNQKRSGITNAEFLKGEIESIPLPDESVDVILSNCVINLSADKDAVFKEGFRVLKPGGRFAVADIVSRVPIPDAIRERIGLWTGCVGGALVDGDYVRRLQAAGFTDVSIQPIRTYTGDDAREVLASEGLTGGIGDLAEELASSLYSGFVRANKPRS